MHRGSDEGPFPGYEPYRFGGGGDPEEAERRRVPVGPLVRAPRRGIDSPPPLEEEVPPEAQASVLARPAVVGDIQVFRNLSLKSASMPVASSLVQGDGGEQSVATNGKGTVIYAMNWTAAISSDGGGTFSLLSPTKLFDNAAGGFCCDQVVTYIPKVDRFVWVMQYSAGQAGVPNSARPNLLRVATATSAELANYDGQRWPGVYYNFGPSSFKSLKSPPRGESIFLDRPFMAFTKAMLHFTVSANNVGGNRNGTLIWRVPVGELGGTVRPRSAFLDGPSFIRPAQGALPLRRSTQYFGQRATTSRLNIFAWPDNSTSITRYEADVPSTGNADLASNAPAGNDWLLRAGGQVSQVSTGAVTGTKVWFGWLAGREAVYDVNGKQRRDRVHDQPTIEFAGFGFQAGRPVLADYDTIEFADYATALPELRAGQGGLGLSFMFGGPTFGPAHAVGFLRPSYAMALTIRNRIGTSGYGDYVGLAQNPRERRCYVAAGSSAIPPNDADPHYVVFGRKGAGCTVPPRLPSPRLPIPTLFRPDLIIDSVTPNASNSAVGIALFNLGRADAVASRLGVAFDGGTETLYDTPALGSGASTTIVAPCPTGSVGAASVTARLDATGFVDESDETNNAFTTALAGCRSP